MRMRSAIAWSMPFVAVGAALVLGAVIPEGSFFSGDGGLKYLMARQFGRGVLSPALQMHATEGIMAAWREGAYPFVPPFVYDLWGRYVPAFPPWFPLLTAPLLTWLGWPGLFVIPVGSVLWMAWEGDRFLRRRVGTHARVLGMAALLLGTPTALYGAMFWEHAPACALFFAGLVRLVAATETASRRSILPGFLMGLSGWLRPELFVLGMLTLVMLRPAVLRADAGKGPAAGRGRVRRWDLVVLGIVAAGGLWMLANLLLFRNVTGVHSFQVTTVGGAARWEMILSVARALLPQPYLFGPVTIVALGLVAAALHPAVRRRLPLAWALSVIAVLFPPAACLMVPNDGGLQWGPRYLLGAFLPAVLAATLLFDAASRMAVRIRVPIRSVVLAAVLAGMVVNAIGAKRLFEVNYGSRTAPVLTVLREVEGPVIVDIDLTAMEIAHVIGNRALLRADRLEELARAMSRLREEGAAAFLYVASRAGDHRTRTRPIRDGTAGVDCAQLASSDLLMAWTCRERRVTVDNRRVPVDHASP